MIPEKLPDLAQVTAHPLNFLQALKFNYDLIEEAI